MTNALSEERVRELRNYGGSFGYGKDSVYMIVALCDYWLSTNALRREPVNTGALSEELLPCPFCGERAESLTHSGQGPTTYYVACMYCCAEVSGGAHKSKAIELWNRRSPALRREPGEVVEVPIQRWNPGVTWINDRAAEPEMFESDVGTFVRWIDHLAALRSALASSQTGKCGTCGTSARPGFIEHTPFEFEPCPSCRPTQEPASASQAGKGDGWQPIESAPREGLIDLCAGERIYSQCYYDHICDEYRRLDHWNRLEMIKLRNGVTHWRPSRLPPRPTQEPGR